MTDNEIVKALECCIKSENCAKCGCSKECDGLTVHKNSLYLINSQKEEIDRLRKSVEEADTANYKKAAEIERLEDELEQALGRSLVLIKDTTAAAIKKFATRLCDGRVSTDPVVIAVKVELEKWREGNDRV